jgi:hypothetical protein
MNFQSQVQCGIAAAFFLSTAATLEGVADPESPAGEERFYRIETIPLPPHVVLETGGLCRMPDGRIMIGTRRGEIWAFHKGDWKRFASGLDEVMGLWPTGPDQLAVSQRPEMTRISDTTGDGEADLFETLADQWNYSGHMYEWTFGPVADREGNLYGSLTCWFFPTLHLSRNPYSGWEIPPPAFHRPDHRTAWRGWCFKLTPAGDFIPFATGLRSPNGLGFSPEGDLFISDNQGEYFGACVLHHVTPGAFHGHPVGLLWGAEASANPFDLPLEELNQRRKAPAIIFPFGPMGQSASEPVWDLTEGKFGPFTGQMFIGDQTKSTVMRVALERVDGEYQGACHPFRAGFQSGNNRLLFDADGSLLVGQTDRGWGAIGGKPHGLQRLVWTGEMPFEIHTMRAVPDGFELVFTKPVDEATAHPPEAYAFQHYHYHYYRRYGSPQVEVTPVQPARIEISPDGYKVKLVLPELIRGKVYEIQVRGVRARDGSPLLHDTAYYTLNRLPKS